MPREIKITGHRGAMAYAPENTALSFVTAEDQEVDEIEFDVRLSSDGVPVILHDAQLDRVTSDVAAGVLVQDLTWEQIKEICLPRGQRILTLQEALDLTHVEIQIEVKDPAAVETIAETLAASPDTQRRSRITCFDPAVLEHSRSVMPDIKRGLITGTFTPEIGARAEEVGAGAVYSGWGGLGRPEVDGLHARGLQVGGWPLRHRQDADLAVRLDLDVVTADDPVAAREWLEEAASSLVPGA